MMTRAEVREVLGDLSDLPSTVEELVERGYMAEHKGGSFLLTEKGEAPADAKSWEGKPDKLKLLER